MKIVTSKKQKNRGFSFIELIVGVTVLTVIIISVYSAYTSIFDIIYTSRAKIDAVDLVDEQLEIVRNMPYSEVGIANSIPVGVLTHVKTLIRDSNQFTVTTTVRNVDDPFDGTVGGTPNDLSPADYKLVEIDIDCALCRHFTPVVVTTTVSPRGLETASTNGALFIKVFDANGNPVKDASVHVVNSSASPIIVIDDVTDSNGQLQIVDAPPGVNAYQITVSKNGYSIDGTLSPSVSNPNPTKPNATVALQQVTAVSFAIDKTSSFVVSSQTTICGAVPNFDFQLAGSKGIGTNPFVYKYNQPKLTNVSGVLTINNLEWDSYSFTGIDSMYDIVGTNPLLPVNLSPNSSQNVLLVVASKNPNTLLVSVRDSATGLALSNATVLLTGPGPDVTRTTGQGTLTQTDWSGGSGQATSTDLTQYFISDGNVDTTTVPGDVVLKKIFSDYVPAGVLTSSTFDTGAASNFQNISWLPGSQSAVVGEGVKFQIATNNDGGTWNYNGPDGTNGTYFTSSNQNIDAANNGRRYFRYKIFESTASTTFTPNISDVSFTYTSSCTPPGQVSFVGLSVGTYSLQISLPGYATQTVSVNVNTAWQNQDVSLIAN